MNTIRRTQENSIDPSVTLSFEGDNGKFWLCMTRLTAMGGCQRVSASYTKEELVQLKKSLDLFFK